MKTFSFYISSRLENHELVRKIRDELTAEGHTITHDWTILGPVRGDVEKIAAVAREEVEGVAKADVFIMLLPGGRGAHVELGIALAHRKSILIWSPDAKLLGSGQETSAFYHHPLVRVVDDLRRLKAMLRDNCAFCSEPLMDGQGVVAVRRHLFDGVRTAGAHVRCAERFTREP